MNNKKAQDVALELVAVGGGALCVSCFNWPGYAAGAMFFAIGLGNYLMRQRSRPLIRINRHGVTRA